MLGPAFADGFETWQRRRLANRLSVTAHPSLQIEQRSAGDRALTLIGYLIDPDNESHGDQEILRELLSRFTSLDKLFGATHRLGGRWLLIAQKAGQSFLFHDPLGLRQAFYTERGSTRGELWVVSQPGLAADRFGLSISPLAQDFIESRAFKRQPEYKWPGTATPFDAVKHLLPNHYLNLQTGKACRYWPSHPLEPLTVEQAVERTASRLQGLMGAIERRFTVALGLTAGWDSRIVLAAGKKIARKLNLISVRQLAMCRNHPDLSIASRLSRRFGLPHEVVTAPSEMSADFRATYQRSVHMAHLHYGPDIEAILNRFGRQVVAVTGSGWEVARGGSRLSVPILERRPTAEYLSSLEFGGLHPFCISALREWLATVPSDMNVHPMELFEWEQGHGNWLAMTQLEFDMAWKDIFVPFNCRDVIETMLRVPDRHRNPPGYRAFSTLIGRMWPELLEEPVNPHKALSWIGYRTLSLRFLAKYCAKRVIRFFRIPCLALFAVVTYGEDFLLCAV